MKKCLLMFAIAISIASCSKSKVDNPSTNTRPHTDINSVDTIMTGNQSYYNIYSLLSGTWISNDLDSATATYDIERGNYDRSAYTEGSDGFINVHDTIQYKAVTYYKVTSKHGLQVIVVQKRVLIGSTIVVYYVDGYNPPTQPYPTTIYTYNGIRRNKAYSYEVPPVEFAFHYYYDKSEAQMKVYFCN